MVLDFRKSKLIWIRHVTDPAGRDCTIAMLVHHPDFHESSLRSFLSARLPCPGRTPGDLLRRASDRFPPEPLEELLESAEPLHQLKVLLHESQKNTKEVAIPARYCISDITTEVYANKRS